MTNGSVLLRNAAKGHLGGDVVGVMLTFPLHNGGANGDIFKGADPTQTLQ